MEEFKALIFEFLTFYNRPKISIKFLVSKYYIQKESIIDDPDIPDDEVLKYNDILYDEVKITVNGYSNSVDYYNRLLLYQKEITDLMWELQKKIKKPDYQQTLDFTLGLFKNILGYFSKEEISETFSYVPPDSPKKLTQFELIYCSKEELKYLDKEKRGNESRGT